MPYANPADRLKNQRRYSASNRDKVNARGRAWRKANPDKARAYARKAYAANPEKHKAKHKAYTAKAKPWLRESNKAAQREWLYGLLRGSFEAMLLAQQSKCAGCGCDISVGAHVDHCHKTNRVRGLICRKCNLALGHANDDPLILRQLAQYLATHADKGDTDGSIP